MKTLKDAWDWYQSARSNLKRMQRLGTHHWNHESLEGTSIRHDDRFRQLEAIDITTETERALLPLEDLGVLVLFSVFEAAVRDHLQGSIEPLTSTLSHPILVQAVSDVLDGIRQGSFANKVLSPLQNQGSISPELSNRVKQVRDYRNWVAHGKRRPRSPDVVNLTVEDAYSRLKDFLDALGIAVEAELMESEFNVQVGEVKFDDNQ